MGYIDVKRLDVLKLPDIVDKPMIYFQCSDVDGNIPNFSYVDIELKGNDKYKGKFRGVLVKNKNGDCTIILKTRWVGYPEHLGKFIFLHTENYSEQKHIKNDNKKHSSSCGCNKNKGLTVTEIILAVVVLLVIISVVVIAALV